MRASSTTLQRVVRTTRAFGGAASPPVWKTNLCFSVLQSTKDRFLQCAADPPPTKILVQGGLLQRCHFSTSSLPPSDDNGNTVTDNTTTPGDENNAPSNDDDNNPATDNDNATTSSTYTAEQQHEDPLARTIYVEGIPFDATQEEVLQWFAYHLDLDPSFSATDLTVSGDIETHWFPVFPDTGRLQGTARITFSTLETKEAAMKLDGMYMGRRYLNIRQAYHNNFHYQGYNTNNYVKNKAGGGAAGRAAAGVASSLLTPEQRERAVLLEGFDYSCTEYDIKAVFAHLGLHDSNAIESTYLPIFNDSGRLRGYGHVVFRDQQMCEKALEADGTYLGRRYLGVKRATPPENRTQEAAEPTPSLVLHQLSFQANEYDIELALQPYGLEHVKQIYIFRKEDGRSTGFGIVNFRSVEAATRVLENKTLLVCSRHAYLNYGRPHLSRQQEQESQFQ